MHGDTKEATSANAETTKLVSTITHTFLCYSINTFPN
jgi:hypothetical protein